MRNEKKEETMIAVDVEEMVLSVQTAVEERRTFPGAKKYFQPLAFNY